ncbi:hypothetical protein GS399_15615 [Pedobacter sp. HMF7647]|uniref:DUF2938 family protein n=1 Tax=Hufsiella arboris TaxID=2695275 RepID=A0A7K1YCT8_9SPHI|nr:DUF2938 domain-containing protein [Hufsiella arboris]MXV52402.1 hypothetical protein [Hufsiella arboris]
MKTLKVASSTITATTLMTMYSYLLSAKKGKDFREPEILAKLIKRLFPGMDNASCRLSGWSAHYLVGLVFVLIYSELWEKTKLKPTLINGLILGGLSGVFGVTVWNLTLKLHPNTPAIDEKRFFGQLLPAHLVFGLFAVIGYRLVRDGYKPLAKRPEPSPDDENADQLIPLTASKY